MSNPASPKDYPGLIAYYPFTGDTLDESGNGNSGPSTAPCLRQTGLGKAAAP